MNSETTKRAYRVRRHDISYLRTTLESYDGMAAVTTLDPGEAVIQVLSAPECENMVGELLQSMRSEEGLLIEEIETTQSDDKAPPETAPSKGSYHIITMGCQMNDYDSDTVARMLMDAGWRPAAEPQDARLVIVNTCSVREKPEHKAVSMLGRMVNAKRRRPDLLLGVMGCFAQQRGAELLRRFPGLNLVMGPRALAAFPQYLARIEADSGQPVLALGSEDFPMQTGFCGDLPRDRVNAQIAVMQGCDNFCTYCIVPYVRGRERSRAPEAILSEAETLLAQGVKEISLLGQNVNSYRWEEGPIRSFPYLLRALDRLAGLERIRFTTSHPKDLSDDLIGSFADLPKLCRHIHLPFQAGSNAILERMGRGYSREGYLALVEKLRRARPGIAISSDVMVGFPGETEEDFEQTLQLIEAVRFDSLYSFKYSDRPGTASTAFPGKISESEKAARLDILQRMQQSITLACNKRLEGTVVEVLVEGASRRGVQATGRTSSNKIVNFNCETCVLGDLVNVLIEESFVNSLRGVPAPLGKSSHGSSPGDPAGNV